MRHARRFLIVALLCLGCGSDADPLEGVPQEWNPLGLRPANPTGGFALPLPSSVYLRDDPSTATGVRVDFAEGSLPINGDHIAIKPDWFNRRDGFSADAHIIVAFPGGVSADNLPGVADPDASLQASSPTLVVDMETNELVPHFAEVDMAAADLPDHQGLLIRPLVRLQPAHRYAVGLRKTLLARDGSALPVPPGFQAILDGTETGHERLERVRPRYPDIFASLEAAGAPRAELLLAWDFVTASDETIRSDMVAGRDAMLAALEAAPGSYGFDVDEDLLPDGWDPAVTQRHVYGTFDVPLLLDQDGDDDSVLARDADGKPHVVGVYKAPFLAVIPACAEAQAPVPILVYGHGLMGSMGEAEGGYPRKAAQHLCMVIVATNWRGMSDQDLAPVMLALNDVNKLPLIMEKLVQGVNNFIALEHQARTVMAASPTFQTTGGEPLLDPTRVFYYGISQGGIFGGSFMAYDPVVTRGVLGVPAVNYSLMLERSSDWPTYQMIMGGSYANYLDREIILHLMQIGWDLTDPVTTANGLLGVNADPVEGVPAKQILIQMAVGDSQVNNIATEYEARLAGIPVLSPTVYTPWGVTAAAGPLQSAVNIFDEHPTPLPSTVTNLPPDGDNGTHGSVRKRQATNDQIKTFLETGDIVQTCMDGDTPVACDCTTGACGDYI